ncbi:hypothetical protein QCA50_002062 [Cerrena zonata]|uniref:RecA family profile 1 domain-containing protein n=1 Tax=Cerrena zonata TaxID=2478898 RepID=A0AAW0GST5_9APHY
MDSTTLADELLAEIQGESLQFLLSSVRDDAVPLGSAGLPALDARLSAVSPHGTPLSRGDILEIQGAAGSGKTHLVYLLLATCVMPRSYRSLTLPGWDKAAVVYDTEGTFDMCRFTDILRTRISETLQTFEPNELPGPLEGCVETIAQQCSAKLFVSRPSSTIQLATSILHLPDLHAEHHDFRHIEVALLVVDSLSSFYWDDRFTMEQLRGQQSGSRNSLNPLHHVLHALQHVKKNVNPVMVLTNWGLNPLHKLSPETKSPFYRQHLHLLPSFNDDYSHSTQRGTQLTAVTSSVIPPHNDASSSPPHNPVVIDAGSRFPITHHITLQYLPLDQLTRDALDGRLEEWRCRSHVHEKSEVLGFVRTFGVAEVGRFSFLL